MSIIHDALKKVQQGLTSKTDETPVNPSSTQTASSYLYENPPQLETLAPSAQETVTIKPPIQNKIKSILALACALVITAVSIFYIYQQFRNDIPIAQRLAKKSFYQLIHKKEIPDFQNKRPEELRPLAQLTLNSPTGISSATAPITLNIHGIMANATGNLALINDQVYQVGDEVDGAKIVKINLDSITVNINGTEKTIFVKDQ